MWKTFSSGGNPYMLKINHIDRIYTIYMSDLIDIWYDEYAEEEIVKKFHECNPSLVVKTEEAILQVLRIFDEISEAEVVINKSNHGVNINVTSEILGLTDTKFKLKYTCDLANSDKKKFVKEITAPMIHTINYLEKQQKMLCDLIQKKDRELEEYKLEKGVVSRADLTTEKFDPSALNRSDGKLILNAYSKSHNFWNSFVSEYGEVEAKVMDINVEPWNHIKKKRKVYSKTSVTKKTS